MTLTTTPPEAEPGYTIGTFPKAVQDEFLAEYHKKYPQDTNHGRRHASG